jgi:hypothetical protein
MFFGFFLLLIAVLISSVSAYYSIAGLIAIFPATAIPIIIMGGVLEIAKLSTTVWLHHYWNRISLQIKMYLIPAIAVLMMITSMGVFGFLSKSHISQMLPNDNITAQIEVLDQKIRVQQDNIATDKQTLSQLDAQINKISNLATDAAGVTKSIKIRNREAAERTDIQTRITKAQDTITQLQATKFPLSAQARKAEADVGPIKYIAQLVYGDKTDPNMLEKAVRWVIIMIVMVFDPLAVVLAISASQTISWAMKEREDRNKASDGAETTSEKELIIEPIELEPKTLEPEILEVIDLEPKAPIKVESEIVTETVIDELQIDNEAEQDIISIQDDTQEKPVIQTPESSDVLSRIQKHKSRQTDYHYK